MKKRIKRIAEPSISKGVVFGVVTFFVSLLLISFITACIINNTENPAGQIEVFGLVALLVAGALSGFGTSKINSERGVFCAIVSAIISVALMFGITAIMSQGQLSAKIFMNYLCLILVSSFFAFLGKKRGGVRRNRR